MRRVLSYGGSGSEGVPASQRLKHRLSLTNGLQLISGNSLEEAGFLALSEEYEKGGVLHRTSGATRNFYSTASALKKLGRRDSRAARKDPFAPVVLVFDEPFQTEKCCNGGEPSSQTGDGYHAEDLNGNHARESHGNHAGNGEVKVGSVERNDVAGICSSLNEQGHGGDDLETTTVAASAPGPLTLPNGTTYVGVEIANDLLQDNCLLRSDVVSNGAQKPSGLSCSEASAQKSTDPSGIDNSITQHVEISESSGRCDPLEFSDVQHGDLCEVGTSAVSRNLPAQEEYLERGSPGVANVSWHDRQTLQAGTSEIDAADSVDARTFTEHDLLDTAVCRTDSDEGTAIDCKNTAAVRIQSCYRGWVQRKNVKLIQQKVVMLQSLVRRNQRRKQYQIIVKSAIVVQKNWRRVQSVRLLNHLRQEQVLMEDARMNNAAVMVQKHWRAVQSLHLLKHLRNEQAVREVIRMNNAAVVVQKHWRAVQSVHLLKHLRNEQAVREVSRMNNAAVVIQKHWRAVQSVRLLLLLRNEQAVREEERISKAATVLQKHWRGAQSRHVLKCLKMELAMREQERKNNAATVLQKHWRGGQSREVVKYLKMEYAAREQDRLNHTATVLQKHWRGTQTRHAVKYLKIEQVTREQDRMNNAAVLLQKHWRVVLSRRVLNGLKMEQAARELDRVNYAATVLQKHWRGTQSRHVMKMERVAREQERRNNAAILLQKQWRGAQSRHMVKGLKMEHAAREQDRINYAAVVLQKHWRGAQSRDMLRHLKMEQVAREQVRMNNAAVLMQKHWRGVQCRHTVKYLRVEQALREQGRLNNAATLLQKHWRRFRSRHVLRSLKMEQEVREELRINNAANVLQKYWRGSQSKHVLRSLKMEQAVREEHRINNAVTVLQKCWRGARSRRVVRNLKMEQVIRDQERVNNAAIVFQKHWRAVQSRRFLTDLKMQQAVRDQERVNYAATVFQKHWRAVQSRGLLTNLKMQQAVRDWERKRNAATVFQKHWRGVQSRHLLTDLKMQQAVRDRERGSNAATVFQKHWRAVQSRRLLTDLKMQQALRDQQKIGDAAIVLQKHWRAVQSRRLLTGLRMEKVVWTQQRNDHAAVVLQKHWRVVQSKHLVECLKMERAVKDQQRYDSAATVLQKHWRGLQSRGLLKHLKMEQAGRAHQRAESAAILVQTHWRGVHARHMTRQLKVEQAARELVVNHAAVVLQTQWRVLQSKHLVSRLKAEHAAREQQVAEKAAIVMQKYWRGHQSRTLSRDDQSCNLVAAGVVLTANSALMSFDESYMHSRDMEAISSSGDGVLDVCVQSKDSGNNSLDSQRGLDCGQLSVLQLGESGLIEGLDSDFSSTARGDLLVQTAGGIEDWNHVPVDQLEECLDTCLTHLRPLPATLSTSSLSQYLLPKLDVPDPPEQLLITDQTMYSNAYESSNINDNVSIPCLDMQSSSHHTLRQLPGSEIELCVANSDCSEMNKVTLPTTSRDDVVNDDNINDVVPSRSSNDSTSPPQETASLQNGIPAQARFQRKLSLKQSEERLQQFAQVFLLQRQISLQQQLAQAAPPFPPGMSSGSEIPSQVAAQSREGKNESTEQAPAQVFRTDATADAERPKENHSVCEIENSDGQLSMKELPVESQDCSVLTKPVGNHPGADVVLDMVLLLRQIEEEHGTSAVDVRGDPSSWYQAEYGDIEEGVPFLERNLGSFRSQNSLLNFANAVSVRHVNIPDVNAVLLVLIAVVVYTRTICRGVFYGTRQTHRRI